MAVLVETPTDNRKPDRAEIRHIFFKNGGIWVRQASFNGCSREGDTSVCPATRFGRTLMEVFGRGADIFQTEGTLGLYIPFENFEQVRQELEASNIPTNRADTMLRRTHCRWKARWPERC